jgi:putative ABC transport system permease protein
VLLFAYGYRSLVARLRANIVTMLAVAVFVGAASLGLSFHHGLSEMLIDTAPPENVIVLSKSAPVESGSVLPLDTARKLLVLDGIKRVSGAPLAVRELVTSVYVGDADDATTIRGIDDQSPAVHHVTVATGALPKPGSLEVALGRRIAQAHPELAVGSELHLPGGACRVTGVLAANGSPFEDEIWTPRSALELHLKSQVTSSVTFVADDAARARTLADKINASKDLDAHASSVADFRDQAANLGTITNVVLLLLAVLSLIACSAIATTMNAAAAVRMPEFAALAAIGIHKSTLGRIVLLESVMLAATGAVLGVAASAIVRSQVTTLTLGANAVDISSGGAVLGLGLGLGLLVGIIGGLYPSRRVKRLDILHALR